MDRFIVLVFQFKQIPNFSINMSETLIVVQSHRLRAHYQH